VFFSRKADILVIMNLKHVFGLCSVAILLAIVIPVTTFAYDFVTVADSPEHAPDGTWWGHNQLKVTQDERYVYYYTIENDTNPATFSKLQLYSYDTQTQTIAAGAELVAASGGNIALDANGALRVWVMQNTDPAIWYEGPIVMHTFPFASSGDLMTHTTEVVADDAVYSVNQRFSVTIDPGTNTAYVAYGVSNDVVHNNALFVLSKDLDNPIDPWSFEVAADNLANEYSYAHVVAKSGRVAVVAEQNDFVGLGLDNIYQKAGVAVRDGGIWNFHIIADLSTEPIAATRARLLEISDVVIAPDTTITIFHKELTHPSEPATTFRIVKTVVDSAGVPAVVPFLDTLGNGYNLNWLRIIYNQGSEYYVASTYDRLYVSDTAITAFTEIPEINADSRFYGSYVYTNARSHNNEDTVIAAYVVNGSSANFPNGQNRLVVLPSGGLETLLFPPPPVIVEPRQTTTGYCKEGARCDIRRNKSAKPADESVSTKEVKELGEIVQNTSESVNDSIVVTSKLAICSHLIHYNQNKSRPVLMSWQQFLRDTTNPNLIVDGIWGPKTRASVMVFQERYRGEILEPIGLPKATGSIGEQTTKQARVVAGC
jgi:hypothetical protein